MTLFHAYGERCKGLPEDAEGLLVPQDQGRQLVPPELKRVGMPEEMPELKIRLELLHDVRRDERRSSFVALGHLLQQTAVPSVPMFYIAVELDSDPPNRFSIPV